MYTQPRDALLSIEFHVVGIEHLALFIFRYSPHSPKQNANSPGQQNDEEVGGEEGEGISFLEKRMEYCVRDLVHFHAYCTILAPAPCPLSAQQSDDDYLASFCLSLSSLCRDKRVWMEHNPTTAK